MHPGHQALLNALHSLSGPDAPVSPGGDPYSGSPHARLGVAVPDLRRLAKSWLAETRGSSTETLLSLVDSLFAGELHDEKTLAALLVGYAKAARRAASPPRVGRWLDELAGWAEIDALCQNAFQAEDFLVDWDAWGPWIRKLASDSNINKRRASLVLLNGPVKGSDDPRLADLAFANIADLQGERGILITKAVSWLLRCLIARHRSDVVRYLDANRGALPAIAVREVSAKLETGRKAASRRIKTGDALGES